MTRVCVRAGAARFRARAMPGATSRPPSMRASVVFLIAFAAPIALAEVEPRQRSRMIQSGRIGEDVIAGLDADGAARVVVVFALPDRRAATTLDPVARHRSIAAVRDAMVGSVARQHLRVRWAWDDLPGIVGDVTVDGVLALLDRPDVARIDVDRQVSVELLEALPLMRVPDVKAAGYTGAGVTVAVIDTGIDSDHPDLADDVVDQACFCTIVPGCCGGAATATGPGSAEDQNGHGTNVTGIITGKGTVAPEGGAPDAKIVAVKVFDPSGRAFSSDVLTGLQYVIDHHPEVRIVNMSLGFPPRYAGACDDRDANAMLYAAAIDTLRERGVATFVAAGNDGDGTAMTVPACVADAISVGAVWDANVGRVASAVCTDETTMADQVTCFSDSDDATDLFAPGAPTTATGRGGGVSTEGGTSQAAPAAAACAADLLQAVPTLAPDDLEAALKASPAIVTDAKNGRSFPRVDCAWALGVVTGMVVPTTTSTSRTSTTRTTTSSRTTTSRTTSTSSSRTTTTSTSRTSTSRTTSTSTTHPTSTTSSSTAVTTSTSSTTTVTRTSVASTSVVVSSSTTTSVAGTTSTTVPACLTARCLATAAIDAGACADESVPPSVTSRLDRAVGLIEQARAAEGRRASKLAKSAARLLKAADRAATKATHGRRARLTSACAGEISRAIAGIRAQSHP